MELIGENEEEEEEERRAVVPDGAEAEGDEEEDRHYTHRPLVVTRLTALLWKSTKRRLRPHSKKQWKNPKYSHAHTQVHM